MKRRAFKLLLFLLAGAIINVAVAWGCVLWSPVTQSSAPFFFESMVENQPWWSPDLITGPHAEPVPTSTFAGIGLRGTIHGADLWGCLIYRSGLPFASCEHAVEFVQINPAQASSAKITPHRAISIRSVLPSRAPDECYVPTYILWPGFAINTIFYAAIVCVLFAAPGAICKRVRRKRGQCTACGYSLRGTPDVEKCPECGAALLL